MKLLRLFLVFTASAVLTGCAPFNKDVPETHAPPTTSPPGETRRP